MSNGMCDDVFIPASVLFELFVAFAICLTAAEFLRRFIPGVVGVRDRRRTTLVLP